jgi:hypothetical protein
MQASVVDKKVETGHVQDREGQAINSEPISVEEDAHMLFRVCSAQLHYMLELRKDKKDIRSKSETSAMQMIMMPKEEQRKNLPHAILAVERGGRVFPRMCLIQFLQQINTRLVKELEDCSQFGLKMFDEVHARVHLAIEDDYPIFVTALQREVVVDESLTQNGTLFSVYQELMRKIVNSRKKEWLNAKKKILQLKKGASTDVSLNLRDELKVYAAKKKTT